MFSMFHYKNYHSFASW